MKCVWGHTFPGGTHITVTPVRFKLVTNTWHKAMGKKIHCFSGKRRAAGSAFNLVGEIPRKPQTGIQKCWSCSRVPGLPPQLSSLAVRITVRSVIRTASLVPRPRIRREKWPGIHCLRMRERFRKFSANKSEYGQVTHGCYAEKKPN